MMIENLFLMLIIRRRKKVVKILDSLALTFFAVEYFARLMCAPNVGHFALEIVSIVDLIAFLPFLISLGKDRVPEIMRVS